MPADRQLVALGGPQRRARRRASCRRRRPRSRARRRARRSASSTIASHCGSSSSIGSSGLGGAEAAQVDRRRGPAGVRRTARAAPARCRRCRRSRAAAAAAGPRPRPTAIRVSTPASSFRCSVSADAVRVGVIGTEFLASSADVHRGLRRQQGATRSVRSLARDPLRRQQRRPREARRDAREGLLDGDRDGDELRRQLRQPRRRPRPGDQGVAGRGHHRGARPRPAVRGPDQGALRRRPRLASSSPPSRTTCSRPSSRPTSRT